MLNFNFGWVKRLNPKKGTSFSSVQVTFQVKSVPTLRAGGRAGAFAPRPKGFSAFERFLPLAFFCQIPRPPLTLAVETVEKGANLP
jgi:hypothetical protein